MGRKKNRPDWQDDALGAVRALKNGEVIMHSTDTVWGLAADALNPDCIDRIFSIKNRPKDSTLMMLVDSPGMLEKYMPDLPEAAWELMDVSDRPVTIVAPCHADARAKLAPGLIAEDKTIAVRLVKDDYVAFIIQGLGRPLASTSANITGSPTPLSFSKIEANVRNGASYVAEHRRKGQPNGTPSMIIRFDKQGRIEVVRS